MANLKECTRCKKVYRFNVLKREDESGVMQEIGVIQTPIGTYDLCDECSAEFEEFMKNKKGVVLLDPEKTHCVDCGRRINKINPSINEINERKFCSVFMRVKEDYEKMCPFWCKK